MTQQFVDFLRVNWLSVLIIIPVFIQISPIKVNPLAWIGKHLFQDLMADTKKGQEELKEKIIEINRETNKKIDTLASVEYSCAVTPRVRKTGNQLSGHAETAYASLLA